MANFQPAKTSFAHLRTPSNRPDTFGEIIALCVRSDSETPNARILRGNLAPGGAVAKITGKEGLNFTGKARTFDTEEEFITAVETGSIRRGEKTVVVLRYLGPKGGPGMREMLKPTSLIMGAGLGHDVACLTDGRFSGG